MTQSRLSSAARRMFGSSLTWSTLPQDVRQADWSATNARAGLLCLPVIAAWVFVGIISGEHEWAVLSVAGAVTAGFGAFQRLASRSRVRPLALTLAGVAVGTWAGSVAAYFGPVPLVVVATACAYAFGALTLLGYAGWWVGLQWMIALLVYGSQPAPPRAAAVNALGVLAGGASQLAFLTAVRPLADHWFQQQRQQPLDQPGAITRVLVRNLHPRTPAGRYALRVAIAVAVATAVNLAWGLPNGYWTPMTAVILLKPDRYETTARALKRVLGTLAGTGATTLAVALLRPDRPQLGLLLLLAVWGCFTLQRVNYALFATCITAYVVLLLSALGLPEPIVAWHRVLATLAGAAIALAAHAVPAVPPPVPDV
jgi:hypothetical protein